MKKNNTYKPPVPPKGLVEMLGTEYFEGSDLNQRKNIKRKPTSGKNVATSQKGMRPKTSSSDVRRKREVEQNRISKQKNTRSSSNDARNKKMSLANERYSGTRKNVSRAEYEANLRGKQGRPVSEREKRLAESKRTKNNRGSSKNVPSRVPSRVDDRKNHGNIKNSKNALDRKSNRRGSQNKPKKAKRPGILQYVFYSVSMLIGFLLTGGDRKKYLSKEKKATFDFSFRRNISVLFVSILVVVMVLNAITPSGKTSVAENRELQQRPKFTVSRFLDGKYASEYSTYLSDQFIRRSSLIKLKAKFDLFLGKKEINGVYIANNGYLMEGFKRSDEEATNMKIEAINTFVRRNPKLRVSLMLVPNKVEIYKHLLPKNVPVDSQVKYIEDIKSRIDSKVKFIDLVETFERSKNGDELYFKTDHHWTSDGAYIAYLEYCKALSLEPFNIKSVTKSLASDSFRGSLYYKNGAQIGDPDNLYLYLKPIDKSKPLTVKYYDTKKKVPTLYDVSKLDERDPYEVFTGGNHTQIKIRTNVSTDRRLLIIKDSYANAMLPYLVENFAEINVLDLRYFTGSVADVIENNDVTDVLFLNNVNTFNSDASILSIDENLGVDEEKVNKK